MNVLMKRFGTDKPVILRLETVGLGRLAALTYGWTSTHLTIVEDEYAGRRIHVPWLDVLSIEVIGQPASV